MSVASEKREELEIRASNIDMNTLIEYDSLKERCMPSIEKSGYSEIDSESILTACIRYGWAQAIEDKIISKFDYIHVRPLEMTDFTKDTEYNFLTFHFDDKVVILYGLEDTTKGKVEPYPILRVGIERYLSKIIDIVDVEDLYYTNYVTFTTPVLYRKGDRAGITFDTHFQGNSKPIPPNLKINGLVFFK